MQPFTAHSGIGCPLGMENVDTDQLIPARFMSRPRSAGYGQFLFHDLRNGLDGQVISDFPLEMPRYFGASILVARRNFGTGSSREAAVYALADFGIRCVLAPSFGDIFFSNAIKNGLLPATLPAEQIDLLIERLQEADEPVLSVDLDACICSGLGLELRFHIDSVRRQHLLNGWDDLDLAMRHADEIEAFGRARRQRFPWTEPSRAGG